MKKIILVLGIVLGMFKTIAQNINGVSTNPQNPINPVFLPWANLHLGSGFTHDPFLNTFNWEDANGNYIPINPLNFNIGSIYNLGAPIPMLHPFNTGLSVDNSIYAQALVDTFVNYRDFWWKDGWELLWLNTNKTPDGFDNFNPNPNSPLPNPQGPIPVNAPYFVLYNKYRGTVRLFSNYWMNASEFGRPQKMTTSLEFVDKDNGVNGLLRVAGSYDRALDQKTIITAIHAPTYNSPNQYQWGVSDFQIGFDPCVCNRSLIQTRLGFRFDAMTKMDIKMSSRSISIEQPITNDNFLEEDYLNLSDYTKNYKSGSRMYGKMTGLLTEYNNAQQKYQSDLANYNSPESVIKRKIIDAAKLGLTATGKSLGGNIAKNLILDDDVKSYITKIAPRVSKYSLGILDLNPDSSERYTKDLQKAAKGLISSGFDLLSTQINVPGGPPLAQVLCKAIAWFTCANTNYITKAN